MSRAEPGVVLRDASALALARSMGGVGAGAAALALIAWYAGWPRLLQLGTGLMAIQFNAAVALLLASLAVVGATVPRWRIATVVAAALALSVAGITLLEYVLEWDTGLDTILYALGVPRRMQPLTILYTSSAGRMAPEAAGAAVATALSALALAFGHRKSTTLMGLVLALCAAGFGVLGLASYAAIADAPPFRRTVTDIALYAVVLSLVSGTGLMLAWVPAVRRHRREWLAFPALVACGGMILSAGAWRMMWEQDRARVAEMLGQEARTASTEIGLQLERRVRAIERLALHAQLLQEAALRHEVVVERQLFPSLDLVISVAPSGDVRWMAPPGADAILAGANVLADSVRAPVFRAAREQTSTQVSVAYAYDSRARAFSVVVPVVAGPSRGWLAARFSVDQLMPENVHPNRDPGAGHMIEDVILAMGERTVFTTGPVEAPATGQVARVELPIRNLTLTLAIWPNAEWLAAMRSSAPLVALLLGCLLSLVSGIAVRQWQNASGRAMALAANQLLLREMEQAARTGGWEFDVATRRIRWTDEVYRIHEVPPDFDPNDVSRDIQFYAEPDRASLDQAFQRAIREGTSYDLELRLVTAKGTHLWVRVSGRPERRNGCTVRVVGHIADITDRKLLEESLQRRTAEFERSNAELERFAYAASHDLQEPLRMVVSFTGLLERKYAGALDAQAREYIGYAVDGALRMQQLIDSLLAYSRVGTRDHAVRPVEVELVFTQVLRNLSVAISESGASITHDPLPRVSGDAMQIMQVLQNLLANAIRFRGAEMPRVHVTSRAVGGQWEFTVTDNGIGIDPRHFDRIFVLFQRLHGHAEYPGTGMGLSICKRVVERHGGRIWVESSPGRGSAFHFTLPRVNDVQSNAESGSGSGARAQFAATGAGAGAGQGAPA